MGLSDVAGLKDEGLVAIAVIGEDDLPGELICSSRLGPAVFSARAQTQHLIQPQHLKGDNHSILPTFDWPYPCPQLVISSFLLEEYFLPD